jgi:polyhydroxyalkanoate synthase
MQEPGNPTAKGSEGEARTDAFTDALRAWQRLLSSSQAFAVAQETRVGTTPCDLIHESGTHRLLRYRRDTPATWAEPVLFCYALVNRPYILDLQPDKSVVRQYLARGFDVYIIDWGSPTQADHVLTLEHYVLDFLKGAVERIAARGPHERIHMLGYCMGGTMSALYAALHPALVESLTLLAAPLDFAPRDSLLNLWTDRATFDVDAFIDAHGNCPASFLQACFQNMKPVQNLLQKNLSLYENLEDAQFLSNFFAMETWVNDNIPVAGETFRRFVKDFYQDNRMVRGELRLGDELVDLRRITCPVLLLTAKNDHLVAPSSTEGIRPHLGTGDIESISIDAGHVGLVVGGKAQRQVWPAATSWLAARSTSSQRPTA